MPAFSARGRVLDLNSVVNHPARPSADHPVWEFFRTSYNIEKISEKEVETLSKEAAAVLMHKRILGGKAGQNGSRGQSTGGRRSHCAPSI